MTDFASLGLAEPILRAVSAEGYTQPTPIQAQAIPAILAGEDVLGIAQTGTGKTAAFVLPLLHRLAAGRTRAAPKTCNILILAPTRELAAQIAECVRTYGRLLRPSLAVVVGGVKPGPQIKAMAHGVDILVATPGRLLDHMNTGAIRLDGAHAVVLDEVDQMLDLGFLPAIKRLFTKLPSARQTIALSATMPKPIRQLADEVLRHPREIAVAPAARPVDRIAQSVSHMPQLDKRAALIGLLKGLPEAHTIVFTRTKHGADRVTQHLDAHGFRSAALHGNKSQSQRERALAAFRDGAITVLVATDIAARGIDVDGVTHVINFELPNVPEAYVHRIGRTARAGTEGAAISFCDPSERGYLRDIERLIGRSLPTQAPVLVQGAGTPRTHAESARPERAPFDRADQPRQRSHQNNGGRGGRPGYGEPRTDDLRDGAGRSWQGRDAHAHDRGDGRSEGAQPRGRFDRREQEARPQGERPARPAQQRADQPRSDQPRGEQARSAPQRSGPQRSGPHRSDGQRSDSQGSRPSGSGVRSGARSGQRRFGGR
jgi:ATP-dependent RNA helicase RhlE